MSSIIFSKTNSINHAPKKLQDELLAILSDSEAINTESMVDLYSNHGCQWTQSVIFWDTLRIRNVDQIYFWRGDMSGELYEALASDRLIEAGCHRAACFPLVHKYIEKENLTYTSGSRLYGLYDEKSDWDGVTLVDDGVFIKTDDSEPYFRLFTPSSLILHASLGNRHAWEFLKAPYDARMNCNERLEEIRIKALQELRNRKIDWRTGSQAYFNFWYRHFYIDPLQESNPSIARWKKQKGWPYKLGYYIYVDLYLSQRAQASGKYSVDITDPEIKAVLCRIKKGDMELQEWMDIIAPMLPKGCDLMDKSGNKPPEFREVQKI